MEAQTGGRKSGRSPFLIQEMVDLIIECLSQSSADLHSCALVSKSWVTKAQSHIFCTVSFSPYEGVEKYEQCLMGLQTYPHLSRFVRHIIISVNSRWLAPVSSIAFPSLQEITIRSGSSRYQIVQLLPIMMETVPTIQAYLRSPSVKRVNFNGYFSIAVLDTYLDDCSSNITSLGLDLRHIAHPVETTAVTTRRQPKINLSHLALLNSQIMSHWLLRPRCAFAVSHLRSVETDARTWFRLQGSLAPSLPSLTSLVLTNFADERYLDLGTLPALRLLDVCTEPSHTRLMHALLRPPAHLTLEIITIRIDIPIYTDEYAYSFDIFTEDAAALVALHPIRRLDVHYVGNDYKKESMRSFFTADFV